MLEEGKPLFQQIAEQIENDILDGTYEEDTAVPSTNELAQFLRINPATAGKGLNLLVDAGVLIKKRGIGMFVAPGATAKLRETRSAAFAEQFIGPLLREAEKLGITTEQLLTMISKETR